MSSADDRALVRKCLRGDTRAFETLVDRYHRVLFQVAYRMLHEREDARDVTQSAFVKAYEKLDTYDARHKFFSWIYRIVVNESLNVLSRRKPTEPLDPRLEARRPSPEDAYAASERDAAVQAALQQLAPDSREVIVLRHFLDQSYREMAETLGIPEKTVKSRLFSARQQLAAILVSRSTTR